MAKRSDQFTRRTGRLAGKAAVSLFRWMTTDQSGIGRLLAYLPLMGFTKTVKYFLLYLLIALIVAVLNGFWITFLICVGIPYLITGRLF